MDDKTKAIIERIKQAGRCYTTSRMSGTEHLPGYGVDVGGTIYFMLEADANEADARKLAELAGVDVSDI